MKTVWVSNETTMVLQSLDNIDEQHKLYNTFYKREVKDNYHVHVYDDARVFNNAVVYGLAEVFGVAEIHDDAHVLNNARVYGNAIVCGSARVYGNAEVFGDAIVFDNVEINDRAIVCDDAEVYGSAWVRGHAIATKRVVSIVGLPYKITLTDKHIQIGCKQFTFEHAKKLAERNIDIDSTDYIIMIKYKDLLLELIKVKENEQ